MNKKWGAVALAVGLLAGCSSEGATTEPKKEPKQAEVKKEVSKPVVKQPTEAEKKAKLQAEVTAYMDQLTPVLNDMSTIMDGITQLSNMGASNPTLMLDSEYIGAVESAEGAIHRVSANARAIDPGSNPIILKIHDLVMDAIDEMEFVGDNYSKSIRNMDADLINECAVHITNMGDYIDQATKIVTSDLTPLLN